MINIIALEEVYMRRLQRGNAFIIVLLVTGILAAGGVFLLARNQGNLTRSFLPQITGSAQDTLPSELQAGQRYIVYSPEALAAAAGKRRVLFFYAAWCPYCRPADKDFQAKADQIPEDVVLFRVNYDTETALKQQYNITYQHTFVQIDENGNEITKWNGGQTKELLAHIK